jgi:hypothetical protein
MFFIEESSEKPKYRPPSKSDSFLYEKGSYFALTALPLIQSPRPPLPIEPTLPRYLHTLHFVYPFLFHITLISIFESAFFFAYVSTLEDNGILNTIQNYVNPLLQGCWNWTTEDRVYVEEILNTIVNTTTLSQEAIIAAQDRSTINASLMHRSWGYVGGLATLTALLTGILVWKKHPPKWKSLFIEQVSMVLLLAMYEWLFFRTIVLPYKAISATEVNQYVVTELHTICNLSIPLE